MKKLLSTVVFLSLLIKFCFGRNSRLGCIEEERQALLKLKQSFEDPSKRLVSWTGEDCCHWTGVGCNSSTGHVFKLDLRLPSHSVSFKRQYMSERLRAGEVDPSLAGLKELEYLDLSGNYFNGSRIPEFIGSLKHLRYLNLSDGGFGGKIPHQLGNLTSLQVLDLSGNQLNGSIPQSLGSLSTLTYLSLSSNRLNGTIPQTLGTLSTLESLVLSNNRLNGIIPQSFGSFSSLISLYLSHNELSGIPESIGQLVNLKRLYISSNPLEGFISELHFVNLSKLEYLDISFNNLTWKVKSNWIPPFSLHSLNMSHCRIGPQFPQWVQTQTSVSSLDLSNSNISGDFSLLPHSSNLYHMDLSANQITGSLPANIADTMPYLDALFLGNNLMNGSLTNSLCDLYSLQILDLSKNMLSGAMPDCWMPSQPLSVINLCSNKLSGTIPRSLGNLSYLKWLHLDDNHFSGGIPLALKSCTKLELLDIGENNISGVIPTWVGGSLLSLKVLRLRKNMFSGIIPLELCRLSNVQILDLALNDLSGGIPHCFDKLKGMTETYAPSPAISEQWQREKLLVFTKGTSLEYTTTMLLLDGLDLSSNKLDGSIPEELCELTGLRMLNLSNNRLIGNIPNQIGNLKSLESFDLSHNTLFGQIPQSMSMLNSLNHLNLSYNNFSGKIPTGNQLQTLNDPSIYAGNLQLCGPPLTKKCDEPAKPSTSSGPGDDDHGEDKKEKILFWFVVTSGYATGLWAVIGILVLKKNWRIAYFRLVGDTKERILAMVAVEVARLKQRIQRFRTE